MAHDSGIRDFHVVALGGLMVFTDPLYAMLPALSFAENLPAMDVGGGATGFLTEHVGLNWGVRYFRSVGQKAEGPVVVANQQLSFWRANMALAIRY